MHNCEIQMNDEWLHMCMYISCPSDANIPKWRELRCLVQATRNSDYLRKLNLIHLVALSYWWPAIECTIAERSWVLFCLLVVTEFTDSDGTHATWWQSMRRSRRSNTTLWVICTNILQHQGHFGFPISRCKHDQCNWLGHRSLCDGGWWDCTAHTMHQERLWASYWLAARLLARLSRWRGC